MSFASLRIADDLIAALSAEGITEPTPIQTSAIPHVMEGLDVIVRSQTGSGKTLAYLLPILQRIDPQIAEVQAMVVAPTQELAMQIVRVAEKLGAMREIRALGLIGGAALKRQVERLKAHPQLVVGTPGRLVELLHMRKLKLHKTRIIVTDEVDQVFKLGEQAAVEQILKGALKDCQFVFVSATIPDQLRAVADRWMTSPRYIDQAGKHNTADSLEHLYFIVEARERIEQLRKLIRHYNPQTSLVFVNGSAEIAEITERLKYHGLQAESLYGDQPKLERTAVLERVRNGNVQVLVATDLAARGLDIPALTHVFHYQPALDADAYVHRSGRTGRMGRKGLVVSLLTPQELFIIRKFEKQLGFTAAEKELYEGRVHDPRRRGSAPLPESTSHSRGKHQETAKTKQREKDRKNKGAPKWLKDKQL